MAIPIFYSYSHKDESYKDILDTHLSILKRQGYLEPWNDRRIAPGENWEEEINLNLQKAKIVLLLVSSNFLASDYCYDSETIFALEQHEKKYCVVIPIILKPCLWSKSHFKHLQALPKNGKPITAWKNKDDAWLNISEGILKVIETLNTKESSPLIDDNIEMNDHNGAMIIGRFEDGMPTVLNEPITESLIEFLRTFNKFYFSPLRIQKWGSKQAGFENFAYFSTEIIRQNLEDLLKAHKLKMKKSKMGNRIYKIL